MVTGHLTAELAVVKEYHKEKTAVKPAEIFLLWLQV